MLQKLSFEWVILSYKSQFLSSFSAFLKKIVLPTSIMRHLNVRLLLTNVSKNGFWVSYTFLQKLSSFKFYSILEENCVVHINNGAIKCKTFVDNCCKNCVWVSYTFLQKPSLFNHFWIRPSFSRNFFVCKINDFGEINIWRFWWRRNVMRKKFHLLIK